MKIPLKTVLMSLVAVGVMCAWSTPTFSQCYGDVHVKLTAAQLYDPVSDMILPNIPDSEVLYFNALPAGGTEEARLKQKALKTMQVRRSLRAYIWSYTTGMKESSYEVVCKGQDLDGLTIFGKLFSQIHSDGSLELKLDVTTSEMIDGSETKITEQVTAKRIVTVPGDSSSDICSLKVDAAEVVELTDCSQEVSDIMKDTLSIGPFVILAEATAAFGFIDVDIWEVPMDRYVQIMR